jgi:MSHA biogenesis protein MshG
MPYFDYYGRDTHGEKVSGMVEKNDQMSVANYLLQQDITPVSIVIHKSNTNIIHWQALKSKLFSARISDEQLVMFCRQMYTINKAGIPLAQGIKSLSLSMSDGALRQALLDIVNRLQAGSGLSSALRHHGLLFNELFISMVQVGENSGNLDAVFLQLSHYIERDIDTRKSIVTATRYPSFVLGAMVAAMVIINIFVIPAFAAMFNRFKAELPLPTQFLIGLSTLFTEYWWLLLLISLAMLIAGYSWLKTPKGRHQWGYCRLKLPLIGSIVRKASLARYARSFSVMLKAGVPLTEAVGLCARIINNPYLATRIEQIKSGVERGDSLIRTHRRSDIFPPLILQMISVGESSGQVDTLLLEVADHYDREVNYDLKSLSSKIEPFLIVLMAFFVLILALGIFLPMWEMYNIQK